MRPLLFLLSLLAALSATPLRLAEAAHDFACTWAEEEEGADLEAPDDGVADDSDATIRAEITQAPVSCAALDLLPVPPSADLPPAWDAALAPEDPPPRPVASLPQRLARLQNFLF